VNWYNIARTALGLWIFANLAFLYVAIIHYLIKFW